jgi:hypothetical protein
MDWKQEIDVTGLSLQNFNDIIKLLQDTCTYLRLKHSHKNSDVELPVYVQNFTNNQVIKALNLLHPNVKTDKIVKRANVVVEKTEFIMKGLKQYPDVRWLGRCQCHLIRLNDYYNARIAIYNDDEDLENNETWDKELALETDLYQYTMCDVMFCKKKGYEDFTFTDYDTSELKMNYYASDAMYGIPMEKTVEEVIHYHQTNSADCQWEESKEMIQQDDSSEKGESENIQYSDNNRDGKSDEEHDLILLKEIELIEEVVQQFNSMPERFSQFIEAEMVLLNSKLSQRTQRSSLTQDKKTKTPRLNKLPLIPTLSTNTVVKQIPLHVIERVQSLINMHTTKNNNQNHYLGSITNKIKYINTKIRSGVNVDKKTGIKYTDILSELQGYLHYFSSR